jgi:hypothetical protein
VICFFVGQMINGWRARRMAWRANRAFGYLQRVRSARKLGDERIAVEHLQQTRTCALLHAGANSTQIVVHRLEEKNSERSGDAVGVELSVRG